MDYRVIILLFRPWPFKCFYLRGKFAIFIKNLLMRLQWNSAMTQSWALLWSKFYYIADMWLSSLSNGFALPIWALYNLRLIVRTTGSLQLLENPWWVFICYCSQNNTFIHTNSDGCDLRFWAKVFCFKFFQAIFKIVCLWVIITV